MNINEPRHGGWFVIPFLNDRKHHRKVGRTASGRPSSLKSNRLPFLGWIPDEVKIASYSNRETNKADSLQARNHFVATSAEFAGTTLFLFFAFSGTQVALLADTPEANTVGALSNPSQLLYISLSFGFSLAVNAWVFFRISGGLFNPAVRHALVQRVRN
jgi:aquaporin related protein